MDDEQPQQPQEAMPDWMLEGAAAVKAAPAPADDAAAAAVEEEEAPAAATAAARRRRRRRPLHKVSDISLPPISDHIFLVRGGRWRSGPILRNFTSKKAWDRLKKTV